MDTRVVLDGEYGADITSSPSRFAFKFGVEPPRRKPGPEGVKTREMEEMFEEFPAGAHIDLPLSKRAMANYVWRWRKKGGVGKFQIRAFKDGVRVWRVA